jgi:amino acid transporter
MPPPQNNGGVSISEGTPSKTQGNVLPLGSDSDLSGNVGNTGEGHLKRDISARQMMLIAAGGSIGAGLFVGSGQALAIGGPGSLVFNFTLVGVMVSMTMACLGEMATSFPVAGAFYDYTVRFVGPQAGFVMGWNFVFNWLIVFPFELTTISAQMKYWSVDIQSWMVIVPFIAFLAIVSFKGAKWFAELEHWLGLCKAVAILTFLSFALVLILAGVSDDPRGALGDRYWKSPGAFLNGFQGFLNVFRIAGMAYGGTEMLGLAVSECRRPHRIMPLATKVVFFRLVVFYVGSLLLLGFVVPADSPDLASVGHGAKTSPFVLAANLAHKPALGNFFNAMIVAALVAMANTSAFASSRALQALCAKGMGPSIFARISPKSGIPIYSLVVAFALGLLAFVTMAPGGEEIFDWLLSLSGISNYITWAAICYSHIRMRAAMHVQGRDASSLIWRSPFGVKGSYVGLVICALGLLSQIGAALWPIDGVYDAKAVIRDLLGFVFMGALWIGYFLYRRFKHCDMQFLVPLVHVDLQTGFRDKMSATIADLEVEEEKAAKMEALGWREDWTWTRKMGFHAKQAVRWPRRRNIQSAMPKLSQTQSERV